MPADVPTLRLDAATARWRELALRRHAYYLDLLRSGRWRHYFTEQELAERLRDVIQATASWSRLAEQATPSHEVPPQACRFAA